MNTHIASSRTTGSEVLETVNVHKRRSGTLEKSCFSAVFFLPSGMLFSTVLYQSTFPVIILPLKR